MGNKASLSPIASAKDRKLTLNKIRDVARSLYKDSEKKSVRSRGPIPTFATPATATTATTAMPDPENPSDDHSSTQESDNDDDDEECEDDEYESTEADSEENDTAYFSDAGYGTQESVLSLDLYDQTSVDSASTHRPEIPDVSANGATDEIQCRYRITMSYQAAHGSSRLWESRAAPLSVSQPVHPQNPMPSTMTTTSGPQLTPAAQTPDPSPPTVPTKDAPQEEPLQSTKLPPLQGPLKSRFTEHFEYRGY